MKLLKKWFNLIAGIALIAGGLTVSSCGTDDDPDEPRVLKVNPTSISMLSTANASVTISITCTDEWTITSRPDWVNLSSTSGNGNTSVVVTALTTNESSKQRTGVLTITSGDLSTNVELTQLAALQSGCEVTIDDEVIMFNSATFKVHFGDKASYYYAGYFPASSAGWSDAKIVAALESDTEPDNCEADDYCSTGEDLTRNTSYVYCFVAYDSNGNRGDVVRRPFTTPAPDMTKTPRVYLKEFSCESWRWVWLTEKNATTTDYFMLAVSGDSAPYLYYAPTSLIGMFIKEDADYDNSYINGQYWQLVRNEDENYLYVATWARREQKWSDVITDAIYNSPSVSPIYAPQRKMVATKNSQQYKVLHSRQRMELKQSVKVIKL